MTSRGRGGTFGHMGALVAMTIPGLAILLIGLAFVEVLWNQLTGTRILPWFEHRKHTPVAATGLEQVAAAFQGSKHYEFEQRQTALMHKEDKSDAAPPRDEIDLRTGSAKLVRRDR